MIFKGTNNRTFDQINEDIAEIGGNFNAYTSYDRTAFYINCLKENVGYAIEILTDIVWNNIIPEEEWKKEQTVILEELKMYSDDTASVCADNAMILANEKNKSRQLVAGTVDTVSQLTAQDIRNFIYANYRTENAALIIVGNIDKQEILDILKIIFAEYELKQGKCGHIGYIHEELLNKEITKRKSVAQSYMIAMLNASKVSDEDNYAENLLAVILGQGFTSRLHKKVREELGLAYHIASSLTPYKDNGFFEISVGLSENNINIVKEIILQEFEDLKENISEEELDIANTNILTMLELSLEKTTGISSYYENSFVTDDWDTIQDTIDKINAVSIEDCKHVANKLFRKDNICYSYIIPRKEDN